MARIKINDLPEKNIEMTGKELNKVFGGGFTLTRNILNIQNLGMISPLKIFKTKISGMERNEDDERIFSGF